MIERSKSRVERLEERLKVVCVTAELSNGDSFTLRQRDILHLCLDGFRRRYAALVGDPPPRTRFARELELLARVAINRENDPLLSVVSSILYQTPEEEK